MLGRLEQESFSLRFHQRTQLEQGAVTHLRCNGTEPKIRPVIPPFRSTVYAILC